MPERLTTAPDPGEPYIGQDNSGCTVAVDSGGNIHSCIDTARDDIAGLMPGGNGERIITQTIYHIKKTGDSWALRNRSSA